MNRWMLVAAGIGLVVGTAAQAQYREGTPPVLTPPSRVQPRPPDFVTPFHEQYQAAGAPRLLLFWNVAFDDETETTVQDVDVTNKKSSRNYDSLEKDTKGKAKDAKLIEGEEKSGETIERIKGSRTIDPAKRRTNLSERNAVQLETAFRQQLRAAGVRLLDRSTSIRLTQAERDRHGVDSKLVEADAVAGKADLLLEVLMVPDAAGPIGSGFKVTVTEVKGGTEIMSHYTVARPMIAAPPPKLVTKDNGFEWQQTQVTASIVDVGVALANEVMANLGPSLPERANKGRR